MKNNKSFYVTEQEAIKLQEYLEEIRFAEKAERFGYKKVSGTRFSLPDSRKNEILWALYERDHEVRNKINGFNDRVLSALEKDDQYCGGADQYVQDIHDRIAQYFGDWKIEYPKHEEDTEEELKPEPRVKINPFSKKKKQ